LADLCQDICCVEIDVSVCRIRIIVGEVEGAYRSVDISVLELFVKLLELVLKLDMGLEPRAGLEAVREGGRLAQKRKL
jgi:hypothetical protein